MYFKRLELFGFKSFADKTKLKFEPGVTAIVGPNGCGKSNISDAMKWVLGEQSAKELRGARMEDVIFNGTANKEPINMAEVSLVLSNTDKTLPIDYDEVIITRRLFRSGESQYLINKMPVRLKDVNDLLAGTGMGTSSYSMIEQGKIGLILSSKPEERRVIFEEASGITKYKAKKKEALRKLEHTETNLIRITDIILEVERQIKSIERQAKKAERYKQDFDVLKEMELKYSLFQYRNILNDVKTTEIENSDLKKREEEAIARHSVLTEEVLRAKATVDSINDELQKTFNNISENEAAIDKNKHTVQIDRERIEELKNKAESLNKEVNSLEEKLTARNNELNELERSLSNIRVEKSQKEALLKETEEESKRVISELDNCHHEVRISKTRIMDIESEGTRTKNELIKIGAEVQNRKARLRRLQSEKESVLKEKSDFDSKIDEINSKFHRSESILNEKKNELTESKAGLEAAEQELRKISTLLYEQRGELEVLKSKQEMIKELVEKNEGFGNSVTAIIDKCSQPGEAINVKLLADVLSIDPGFEQVMESVLGELTNAVIVDKREEAYRLINYIRTENMGRANFVVMDDVREGFIDDGSNMPDICKKLNAYVKVPYGYGKLLNFLFKDIYMVESSEVADSLFGKYPECGFVTKTGYLRRGARILDGALIEAETSVLGRKERLREISVHIETTNQRIMDARARQQNEEKLLNNIKLDVKDNEENLRKVEREFAGVESERQSLLNNLKRMDDEKTVLEVEIFEEEEAVNSLVIKGEQLNSELNRIEKENGHVQTLIFNYENSIKEKADLKEKTLLKIADIKGELVSINISFNNASTNLQNRKEECEYVSGEINSKKIQMDSSMARVEELQNEILTLEAEQQALHENKEYLFKSKDELLTKKSYVVSEFSKKETVLKEVESEIETIRNNKRDLDVKLSEIRFKSTSMVDRISQNYKEDLTTLNMEVDDGSNWEEIKDKIAELKGKLDRMGAVNLIAIEEHKELEERFNFLTKQRDDLVNAKDALHKAIVKINATTRKLFQETFNKVREEFKNYFRMLFGGGQAEVFLLDERDVLESGIEIVVRPPGKKLQNILLLSGGEKALTAIALLFAIFKVNPSPFCVLDEIDAPLDELNIDRFSRVLEEFLKISQFIIITHSKKTIQMANVLYGITMAEKGVSRIVSVKFSDNKEKDSELKEVLV